jgi:multicomponent Na+:H+ antiporter subunit D
VSKWRLLTGAVESGAWAAAGALLASTLLSVAYFTPIVVRAFGPALSGQGHAGGHGEAPLTVLVPLLLTAAAGLVLGLAPDAGGHFLALARAVAESVNR